MQNPLQMQRPPASQVPPPVGQTNRTSSPDLAPSCSSKQASLELTASQQDLLRLAINTAATTAKGHSAPAPLSSIRTSGSSASIPSDDDSGPAFPASPIFQRLLDEQIIFRPQPIDDGTASSRPSNHRMSIEDAFSQLESVFASDSPASRSSSQIVLNPNSINVMATDGFSMSLEAVDDASPSQSPAATRMMLFGMDDGDSVVDNEEDTDNALSASMAVLAGSPPAQVVPTSPLAQKSQTAADLSAAEMVDEVPAADDCSDDDVEGEQSESEDQDSGPAPTTLVGSVGIDERDDELWSIEVAEDQEAPRKGSVTRGMSVELSDKFLSYLNSLPTTRSCSLSSDKRAKPEPDDDITPRTSQDIGVSATVLATAGEAERSVTPTAHVTADNSDARPTSMAAPSRHSSIGSLLSEVMAAMDAVAAEGAERQKKQRSSMTPSINSIDELLSAEDNKTPSATGSLSAIPENALATNATSAAPPLVSGSSRGSSRSSVLSDASSCPSPTVAAARQSKASIASADSKTQVLTKEALETLSTMEPQPVFHHQSVAMEAASSEAGSRQSTFNRKQSLDAILDTVSPQSSRMRSQSHSIVGSRSGSQSSLVLGSNEELVERTNDLRKKIAEQSAANVRLERDIRLVDQRIALLLTHRITIAEHESRPIAYCSPRPQEMLKVGPKAYAYGSLFYLLQNTPRYIAQLAQKLTLSEIDGFLQTIMFTIYAGGAGNRPGSEGGDEASARGSTDAGAGDSAGNRGSGTAADNGAAAASADAPSPASEEEELASSRREEHMLLAMFEHALKMEFDSAADLGSLMRSNTAVSRMMTSYTRRGQGQQYLKSVLEPHLQSVYNLKSASLEIDPMKVYSELAKQDSSMPPAATTSPEEAMAHAGVQACIEERCQQLQQTVDGFLSAITDSLEQVPFGVRWLCKTIRSLVRKRYPNATHENMMSLIGGFFLLRYVNPGIVTPEAFGLVKSRPTPEIRRNLTLVAKLLQSMGNSAAYTKVKLANSLNTFLRSNQVRLHNFFDRLCDVDDFYQVYCLEKINALAQMDLSLHISVNEVFSIHQLLEKYRDQLKLKPSDKLLSVLEELGPAPPLLARKDDTKVDLTLVSQWEPASTAAARLAESTAGDGSSSHNSSSTTVGSETRERERGGRASLASLSSVLGMPNSSGSLSRRTDVLDLEGFGLLSQTRREHCEQARQMQATYERMCANYRFLSSKLEAYQSYLANVRGQAKVTGTLQTEFPSIAYPEASNHAVTGKARTLRRIIASGPAVPLTPTISRPIGPFAHKLPRLDKEGVVVSSSDEIPGIGDVLRQSVSLLVGMPQPGLISFSVVVKGMDEPLVEQTNLFEDLLATLEQAEPIWDLDNLVQLSVPKLLLLLDRTIFKPSKPTGGVAFHRGGGANSASSA